MARLLIYDAYENKVYTYANLNENDPMPYSTGTTLRVREFRGKSASRTLWTTIAAMEAWNLTRRKYGSGIPVGYAFRRIWEGGHGTRSQHYAGVAFDVGQRLSQTAAHRHLQRRPEHRGLGLCGAFEPDPHLGAHGPPLRHPRLQRHHGRLPHPAAGQPGLLCDDPAGRSFHPGLPDRQPHRRRIRCPHRGSSARLPAAHQSLGGRGVRLQQLEKDQHRRAGRGSYQDHHRLIFCAKKPGSIRRLRASHFSG